METLDYVTSQVSYQRDDAIPNILDFFDKNISRKTRLLATQIFTIYTQISKGYFVPKPSFKCKSDSSIYFI